MNSTLSTVPRRHDHPPQPTERYEYVVRRVGLIDRVALRLGVALITWGRRPSAIPTRERRANSFEQNVLRLERERQWERTARLNLPTIR